MESNTSDPIASPHHAATVSLPHVSSRSQTAADTVTAPPDLPLTLIESEESGVQLAFCDLWAYRELLYFLTWRDIKVRYKQTLMGAAWVIVQPLATMILFTLFFNRFAGVRSDDMPYPLFAYTGLLLWSFFAGGVINSTNSLVNNTNLITKVYFPRMFIPAAAVAAGLVDLAVASVVLFALALYYGVALTWSLLLLPVFVALTVTVMNPDYMSVLWSDPRGHNLLAAAAAMQVVGMLVIRKILRIKI